MFSKEEAKALKIEFWNRLEKQMEKTRNPHGSKVNWMSYNTGIKQLYFRMEADECGCKLCIDLQFKDKDIREIFYQQFQEFENMLNNTFKGLKWYENYDHWNGKIVSRIAIEQEGSNMLKKEDWDKMHLFLKLNFKKLDEFWTEFGEVFKNLK